MDKQLLDILVCPSCKKALGYRSEQSELWCKACRLAYPIEDGIPVMLDTKARELTQAELAG